MPDVAFGVPPVGGPADAEASRFTRARSHRLETVAPGAVSRNGPREDRCCGCVLP